MLSSEFEFRTIWSKVSFHSFLISDIIIFELSLSPISLQMVNVEFENWTLGFEPSLWFMDLNISDLSDKWEIWKSNIRLRVDFQFESCRVWQQFAQFVKDCENWIVNFDIQ